MWVFFSKILKIKNKKKLNKIWSKASKQAKKVLNPKLKKSFWVLSAKEIKRKNILEN